MLVASWVLLVVDDVLVGEVCSIVEAVVKHEPGKHFDLVGKLHSPDIAYISVFIRLLRRRT